MSSPCLKKIQSLLFFRQKLSAASRLPLASSCLRTIRQKLSAASRLPLACIKFCSQNFLRQKCEALPCVKASPQGGGSLQSKVVRGCFIFQRGCFIFQRGCSIFHRLLAFPFVNPCRIAVRQSRQAERRTIASRERSKSAYAVRSLLRVAVQ